VQFRLRLSGVVVAVLSVVLLDDEAETTIAAVPTPLLVRRAIAAAMGRAERNGYGKA
jgi:hypothetical protein